LPRGASGNGDDPERSLEAVQARLSESRGVLLEYTDTTLNPLNVFLVTPDTVVAGVLPPARTLLPDANVAVSLLAADGTGGNVVPPLWRLGHALVDPVAANIPEGTERIFVVPPAALAEVPFEALRTAPSVADSAILALIRQKPHGIPGEGNGDSMRGRRQPAATHTG